MLRSMYSGIGGLRGFQNKLDVIGNNIANVNTTGFKKSRIQFQDVLSQTMAGGSAPTEDKQGGTNPRQIGLGSTLATIDVIHTQGGFMTTSVPSDLAIEGNGFFMVQDPNGQFLLTRSGNFSFDQKGNLVNSNGYFVVNSEGSPLNLGDDMTMDKIKSYSIGADGKVTYTDDEGNTNTTELGIGIAMIENPAGLEKIGANLYKVTTSATKEENVEDPKQALGVASEGARGAIRSGMLEMSNVDLSEEFTEMIVAQRGFQANSRIITTSDSILEELVNLKR